MTVSFSSRIGNEATNQGLATALRSSSGKVRHRWSELLKTRPGLNLLHPERLLGIDPAQLLDKIADSLQAPPDNHPLEPPNRVCQRLIHIIHAHALLRQAIIEQLEAALQRELACAELNTLCQAIEASMCDQLAMAVEQPLTQLQDQAATQSGLLSVLSHDLRSELNGLVLMLEVLRRGLQRQPQHADTINDLKLVRQSIDEMATLLDRHSLLERLQQGRTPVRSQSIPLRDLAELEAAAFADAAKAKGIQLVIDIPAEATLYADRFLLSTWLHNLLDNAIKHGSPGIVRLHAERRDHGAWTLDLTDSGPGMPPERLQALLDTRRRLALKERGFGLLIVQHAGQLFGARLEAHSQVGVGTTFRLVMDENP